MKVPVANCDEKYYNVQKKSDIQLSDYLKYWQNYSSKSHSDLPCLYLKDWHFTQDFPEENIYRTPKYFASDWLNEYYSAKTSIRDDYRFVYMGPKGSWTPLHADVFTSFSWSVNVCGRKRWLLFPPGEELCLQDRFGQLIYDATAPELQDEKKYPRYKELCSSEEIIQETGEAIFIPSGWHHQVWNLEDTISINHNWVNGCNIETMWASLKDNLMAVKKEVEDCKDMEGWDEHCQLILQAMFGMNYEEFYSFLTFIGNKRLDSLRENKLILLFGNWQLGRNHILFDLEQLKRVLITFIKDTDTRSLNFFKNLDNQPEQLIKEIEHYFV
ncbi:JmjC domain-containing protein 4 [Cryptotermes secundus]|uniref:Jumonji domain-containing protein 4 n=3 Tax=Cryptotermes secundus TaxID=105785 RepID=A0A2J7RL38_9NEOP|nr:JmjC domain-containing protein 4 [Cryptotermes secundus]